MTPPSLIETIAPFVAAHESMIFFLATVLARMSAIVFLAPGFGEQTFPMRIRLMIAFALVAVVAPGLDAEKSAYAPAQAAAIVGAEAANGLIIGFSLRAVLFVLNVAGAIISQHMSLTQLFGVSVLADQESALSSILTMALLAAGASMGLHIEIAASAIRTYDVLPFGVWPAGADIGEWSTQTAGEILNIALSISIPFVLLGLAYSLAIAAASRAMPQFSAIFVGLPASLFAGLVLFAATGLIIVNRSMEIFVKAIDAAPWGMQ